MSKILLVDDDSIILDLFAERLRRDGYELFCASCAAEALTISEKELIDLAVLDYSLPDLCGAELFSQLRAGNPALPVIFLTGYPNLETAVSLMKIGARDYITKPCGAEQLSSHIRKLLYSDRPQGAGTNSVAGSHIPGNYLFGKSDIMRAIDTQVQVLPRYPDTTVLITGPTGTGKSAVARRIHELTCGSKAPFIEIDCSTIPRELCESELFGHEKGSFTGAHRTKQGLFEAAENGTAFLDEIGELDLPIQAKFLRVLEARKFKRVGGHATLPMTARVIAATNRSLPDLVNTGRFREDLYFRLNVFELWMPPLKDRGEDVLMLAQHFLDHFAAHYRKDILGFSPEALDYLHNCDFPGNVRELRNMIERAVIMTNTSYIQFPQLVSLNRPSSTLPPPPPGDFEPDDQDSETDSVSLGRSTDSLNLASIERNKLVEALDAAHGNKSKAARLVGLSRTAFHRRLQKYQLQA